jgi:hypothetical protein
MSPKSLRVKLRPSKFFMRAGCVLCGEEFNLIGVRATVWDEQERIGNICYECLHKGPKEFPSILEAHIQRLRREAEDLEKLSKRPLECPSWETFKELEKLTDSFEKQFYGSEDYEDAFIQLEQRFKEILKEAK